MDYVVLVNDQDNEIGLEEKLAAHKYPGKLHRAFSIFILNHKRQLLIQKRNQEKLTWPGFWSNSCCSHPRPHEAIQLAAQRRLKEELGFSCELKFLFKFEYQAKFNRDWGEKELDHVFLGFYNGAVHPNPEEVEDYHWMDLNVLREELQSHTGRQRYSPWLNECYEDFFKEQEMENWPRESTIP